MTTLTEDVSAMNDAPMQTEEPANLKFLRRLVTVLTGTMIFGVVVIIGLLVMRINAKPATQVHPDSITLPDGSAASAYTVGDGWYAVVIGGNKILIFDHDTGTLRQTIEIK